MRGLTTALTTVALLLGPAAAMAQATGALQPNPFRAPGTTAPAAPVSPSPQALPHTASPQTLSTPQAGANQFPSEAAARQTCGADTVVWVNTGGSKAWHVSGDRYYGHTKRGAFMCQQAAQQAGYHPSGAPTRATRASSQTH